MQTSNYPQSYEEFGATFEKKINLVKEYDVAGLPRLESNSDPGGSKADIPTAQRNIPRRQFDWNHLQLQQ
jgi:hypothetical protein